jgi:hypothetical protein
MSEHKHTKGPWMSFDAGTVVITDDHQSLLIADLSGCEVAAIAERQANAHLIAAAPELLGALKALRKEAVECAGYGTGGEALRAAWECADLAIAKAEGRS